VSLPVKGGHDAATCFLVSQFILEQEARSAFFHSIAQRLKPGGILASSDLASDVGSKVYEELLKDWLYMMTATDVTPERLEQMRVTYDNHVSILPPMTVAAIIESGGFETPVQFFQAGLIHAWHSKSQYLGNSKKIIRQFL
jgi:tRNA (cmo5U34)-methyltransferase